MKIELRFLVVGTSIKGEYVALQLKLAETNQVVKKPTIESEDAKIAKEMGEQMMAPLRELMQREGITTFDAIIPVKPADYIKLGKPAVGDSIILVLELDKPEEHSILGG